MTALASTATAKEDHSKKEVTATVRKLLEEGKHQTAKKLLEENDLEHSFAITRPGNSTSISPQNGRYVSPSAHEDTELVVGVYENLSGTYDVMNRWTLVEEGSWLTSNNVCPDDGAAIFWNENHWQPVSLGRSNFDTDYSYVEYGEYSGSGGVLAEVDIAAPASNNGRDRKTGSFWIELEAISSNAQQYPVKGQYKHTWIDTTTRTCSGASAGLGLGPVSISLSGDVQSWSMAAQDTY